MTTTEAPSPRAIVDQLDRTGSCARPVRIVSFREGYPEDDRVMLLPCKDRRAAVCPACSHTPWRQQLPICSSSSQQRHSCRL